MAVVRLGRGRRLMEEADTLLATYLNAVDERWRERDRQSARTARWVQVLSLLGTVTAVGLMIAAGRMLQRQVRRRHDAELSARAALEAAQVASRAKGQFLANMSHEIRTPMNGVLGMIGLVLDSRLNAQQREHLLMAKDSAEHLLALIDDILDFSKIEAGHVQFRHEPFGLRDAVVSALKALSLRAHAKGLELTYGVAPDVPDRLVGDAHRLRQVLVNLVGNAVKFTAAGEVEVKVDLLDCRLQIADCKLEEGAEGRSPVSNLQSKICDLQFSVKDTGIGIPEEKRETIFRLFEQVDNSTSRRFGGTGLGLAISRQLVERMGGDIWVESVPGEGSVFRFTARFEVDSSLPAGLAPPAQLAGVRALVADDNATNRQLFCELLDRWGLRPTAVEDGEAALAELDRARQAGQPYELALLDVNMPRLGGFGVAERLLSGDERPGLLLLSSEGRPADAERCRGLGVTRLITKPVAPAELLAAVSEALHLSAASATPVPDRGPASRPLRILLAEDNPVNQRLTVMLLERLGHAVTVAGDGARALELADREPFDAVLMDVQMPGMDGVEATTRLRDRERAGGRPRTPVVALTAHVMPADRERCLAAGMDFYLTKPVNAEVLTETLGRIGPSAPAAGADGPSRRDVQRAMIAGLGDEDLLAELAGLFATESRASLAALRAGIEAGDADKVERSAHALRGAALSLGGAQVGEVAGRIERLARASNLADVGPALAELEREVESLLSVLTAGPS